MNFLNRFKFVPRWKYDMNLAELARISAYNDELKEQLETLRYVHQKLVERTNKVVNILDKAPIFQNQKPAPTLKTLREADVLRAQDQEARQLAHERVLRAQDQEARQLAHERARQRVDQEFILPVVMFESPRYHTPETPEAPEITSGGGGDFGGGGAESSWSSSDSSSSSSDSSDSSSSSSTSD